MENVPDTRLDFLGNFVQKTLKLKPEKWARLLATEELKVVVLEFLDKPETIILIILQNAAAQLIPSTSFPVNLKSKAAYFIKKAKLVVPKENLSDVLILGDMATKPIEQLAVLVDEVFFTKLFLPSKPAEVLEGDNKTICWFQIFVPLLSNPSNHKNWPPVVAQDVSQHVHSLKSTVHQVKGQVCGQTVLPMPVGIERVHEAERELTESNGEIVDLYLKSAIEGVIIKWATQINDILTEESGQAFANGQNPTPSAALTEAKDICKFLKPLSKHFTTLEETDFADVSPCLKPLMHVVCLVWANSRYYCNSGKIIILLKQICNLIIQQAKRYLDPTSIFQTDVDEAKQRVQLSITVLKTFREIFDEYKDNLVPFFKDRPPQLWTFHPNVIFGRFQLFLDRLHTIQWFFDTVLEFMKLERVEIGGLKGRALSSRIITVSREFNDHFTVFATKTYDVLDPEDPSFLIDYESFQKNIEDLDRRLASILCQAFDDCSNLESVFKLIEIVGSVLERPLIKEEFTTKYQMIVNMLEFEMSTSEELFNEHMEEFMTTGRMPVAKNMPPVAGALQWTAQLRQRITLPVHSFKSLDHIIVQSPDAQAVIERYERLMALLAEFDQRLFSEWTNLVPSQIARNLKRSLLTRTKNNSELLLNFHNQLTAILREVHYLQLAEKEDIPEEAIKLYEKRDVFRKYTVQLNLTIEWYVALRPYTFYLTYTVFSLEQTAPK
ncbi:hypothetical protein J6590_052486 [Homalodisca vitripennis]|nr:hypothetical protein J6590_052486 [Homalodisca vitripennis]